LPYRFKTARSKPARAGRESGQPFAVAVVTNSFTGDLIDFDLLGALDQRDKTR
jgi:hypothetical protein